MTDYSDHRFYTYESDAFDPSLPTEVDNLRLLFETANHTLDSQLQTRISTSFPEQGWPTLGVTEFDGEFRMVYTVEVPWRVLSYGSDKAALARPIVFLAGGISPLNEFVDAVDFAVSMQRIGSPARIRGTDYIARWFGDTLTTTTPTAAIISTDDIDEDRLASNPPENTKKALPLIEINAAGDPYAAMFSMVMVRFTVWAKITWDGGEDWLVPPAFVANMMVREGAR